MNNRTPREIESWREGKVKMFTFMSALFPGCLYIEIHVINQNQNCKMQRESTCTLKILLVWFCLMFLHSETSDPRFVLIGKNTSILWTYRVEYQQLVSKTHSQRRSDEEAGQLARLNVQKTEKKSLRAVEAWWTNWMTVSLHHHTKLSGLCWLDNSTWTW